MGKNLVAHHSRSVNTEKMAKYLAEGLRITGNIVHIDKISNLQTLDSLLDFDA